MILSTNKSQARQSSTNESGELCTDVDAGYSLVGVVSWGNGCAAPGLNLDYIFNKITKIY